MIERESCCLTALHYNNCLFIAHHIITIDKMFRLKLTMAGSLLPAEGRQPQLAELVPKMRRVGNDSFTEHIKMKNADVCKLLADAAGN